MIRRHRADIHQILLAGICIFHVSEDLGNDKTFRTMNTMKKKKVGVIDHVIDGAVEEWVKVNQLTSLVGNILARSVSDHLSIAFLPRSA